MFDAARRDPGLAARRAHVPHLLVLDGGSASGHSCELATVQYGAARGTASGNRTLMALILYRLLVYPLMLYHVRWSCYQLLMVHQLQVVYQLLLVYLQLYISCS